MSSVRVWGPGGSVVVGGGGDAGVKGERDGRGGIVELWVGNVSKCSLYTF